MQPDFCEDRHSHTVHTVSARTHPPVSGFHCAMQYHDTELNRKIVAGF